jgi:hypothetical protein
MLEIDVLETDVLDIEILENRNGLVTSFSLSSQFTSLQPQTGLPPCEKDAL